MEAPHITQLRQQGYAVVRGFLPADELARVADAVDEMYAEGMTHHATYRDRNLCFEVLNDPQAQRKIIIQAYWFSWISAPLEAQRRDMRYFELLEPLLGPDIKQISNQIHWKPPGAKYTSYRFHQDVRFREKPEAFTNLETHYITTGLAIDRQDAENGALRMFPASHTRGYLGLNDDGPVMKGRDSAAELAAAGLDARDAVVVELEPGDLVMWGLYTVHGSAPNLSPDRDRRLILNSYVRASDSPDRGEWAFRGGRSTPLGPKPQLCRFEDLHDHPEPFYIEEDWIGEETGV